MKPTALGLLIAAAAFGASTLYLSVQLHEERAQSDKLAAETRTLNARIAELEKARAGRRFATVNPFAPGMAPPGPPPGHPVRVEEISGPEGDFVEDAAINAPPRNDEFFNKMMRSQIRAQTKHTYADLGARLGLNKEQANKLIDLLTDQQLEGITTTGEPASIDATMRLLAEKNRNDKAEITDLIGAGKAGLLEEYQLSLPAQQELEGLVRQFDGVDASLSDEQQKRLLSILVDERKRVPAPEVTDAASMGDYAKAYLSWQEDYDDRVAAQARPILNSEQLATYNEYQEWHQQFRAQMGTVGARRIQRYPTGRSVSYTDAAPMMSADLAIAAPAPAEKPRK